ncbi:MAG TPA: 16S rRNA (cytosine(1402)-N(4))-methyltransferase RsmH [Candidatus Paceibacterota bacterium]|nr:16S rRNA (cytosine(1402)-N(4))-methyltransferase RsmH [Candidatus Paceibacterota bacterium]
MHIPVLLQEVIKFLNPQSNENFIDMTVGEGRYAMAILQYTAPLGKILGIDLDEESLKVAKENLGAFENRAILKQGNYKDIDKIVKEVDILPVSGIVFDLGLGIFQIEDSSRGFSFLRDEPLKMTFDLGSEMSAEKVINESNLELLTKIFQEYGEEKNAYKIAQAIVEERKNKKITRTSELVEIIEKTVDGRRNRLHPATKIFQALRIYVNDELNNLKEGLEKSVKILDKDGRIAVVSYHSLEDRLVKKFYKEKEKEGVLKIITKKPITPTKVEILNNRRSRSAKLRVAQKIK